MGVAVGPSLIDRRPTLRVPSVGRAEAVSPAATASLAHREDIQGLRAVAVLLVVFAHAGVGFMAGGFVGVDVFFVLSGFLITGLLLAESRKSGLGVPARVLRPARAADPARRHADAGGDRRRRVPPRELRARARDRRRQPARRRVRRKLPLRGARASTTSPRATRPRRCSTTGRSRSRSSSTSSGLCCSHSRCSASRCGRRRDEPPAAKRRLLLVLMPCSRRPRSSTRSISRRRLPTTAYFSPFTRAWELGLGATLAVGAVEARATPAAAKVVLGWAGIGGDRRRCARSSPTATPFPGCGCARCRRSGRRARSSPGWATGRRGWRSGGCSRCARCRIIGDRSYALYLWHWPVLILAAGYAGHALALPVKLEPDGGRVRTLVRLVCA